MKLDGKVAVVTGAGNGIGEAIARRFAAEGANVIVTDIEADAVDRVADEIGAIGLAADVGVEQNVQAVVEFARSHHGEVDVWMSNAGLSGPQQRADLQEDGLWDAMWGVHVLSHLYAARAVLPSMVARGDGYLLQTASSVALGTHLEKAAYSVTKHASLAFSEWLATNYRPQGVKVSCFCPGPMLTRMLLSNDFDENHPALRNAVTPEQVAEIVVDGIAAEKFLILTHDESHDPLVAKGADYDAWIDSIGGRYFAAESTTSRDN